MPTTVLDVVSPTRVPVNPELPGPEQRRSTGGLRRHDVFALLGSVLAAVGLASWLQNQLFAFQGVLAFIIVAHALFMLFYAVLIGLTESAPVVVDKLVTTLVHSLGFVMLLALAAVVTFTFGRGWEALAHVNFFTQDMSNAGPLDPLTAGGVLHGMAGTLIMISIALAISVPLGITTAVFLSEFPGRYAAVVRTVVEAMTALPSIVAGLFIYATIILGLGIERSGFAASCAVTVMMLPIIIRSADVVLRLVPGNLKEAAFALGSSRWRTVWTVTLPTARSGLTTAVVLGTARGIGETSPVLLTAGLTTFLNLNPFSGPMVSLPLATFAFVKSPEPSMIARGFGSAAVLMLVVLVLFWLARVIGGRGPGQLTPRQNRRITENSRALNYRYLAKDVSIQRASRALSAEGKSRRSAVQRTKGKPS
ncbi:phosphate ABC transporter permease PstA [Cryobacterium melibiosiphilum]|uniref:Phosphate transport system permease protein PstA n=1 Tax=Cryobacterium melibiosiphilum TaxID=995039 RepID=A0A3A5MBN1_9MICO|nr:phosphate ABC transporter permease PstA [Cryobacterium melibiosiphilum]RJT86902.1 phosphate ABC transporter permease PstA [Cryobacterium melibiosiphilum]